MRVLLQMKLSCKFQTLCPRNPLIEMYFGSFPLVLLVHNIVYQPEVKTL